MEFGVSPPCAVRLSRNQRAGQNRQPFLNRTGQSERLGQQAVEPRLVVAPSRRLRCRKAIADPLHHGLARPTLCQGLASEDLAKSREEGEPMLIRKGDQLICELLDLGRFSRGDRHQADEEKRISEDMEVAELPCSPECHVPTTQESG
jgi:hypothetical protein